MNPARFPMTLADAEPAPRDWTELIAGPQLWWCLAIAGSLGFGLLSLALRPLLPVDETRYLAVAWEMWQRGQFLLPLLNGELYVHKPPLLFWLVHAGWAIGGVGEVWPRLIGPLATLACTWLLSRLGRQLWPQTPRVGRVGSLMFLSTVFVAFYGTALMFDLPLLVFVCLGWLALHRAVQGGRWRHWAGFGLAFAAALLTKGPVAAVYLLPPLLMARGWAPVDAAAVRPPRVAVALAIALLPPLAWLLWADDVSSGQLLHRVFFEQTLGRVQGDLGHPRPVYWYLPWLPLMALPWALWPGFWRAVGAAWQARGDRGQRFLAVTGASGFLVLSLVGGKQVHYLLPLLALLMLAVAQGLSSEEALRATRGAGASLLAIGIVMAAGFAVLAPRYDLTAAARHAAREQRSGRPVLYVGNYQGELGFLGRLQAPVHELAPEAAGSWIRRHPDGLVITRRKRLQQRGQPRPEFVQRYKGEDLLMFRAADLSATGSGFREPTKAAAR